MSEEIYNYEFDDKLNYKYMRRLKLNDGDCDSDYFKENYFKETNDFSYFPKNFFMEQADKMILKDKEKITKDELGKETETFRLVELKEEALDVEWTGQIEGTISSLEV